MQRITLTLFVLVLSMAFTGFVIAQPTLIGEIEGVPDEDSYFGAYTTALDKGDVNGDGYTDLIVGARGHDLIRIFFGTDVGIDATADLTLIAPPEIRNMTAMYGRAVGVGDLNNDGYDDVVAGAGWTPSGGGSSAGNLYIYMGGAEMDTTYDLHIPCPHPFKTNAWFGYSVEVGYCNDDDYEDIYVSATRASIWGMEPYQFPGFGYADTSETYHGVIYFYAGAAEIDDVYDMNPIMGLSSSAQAGNRGMDLADVDGDGWEDLLLDGHGTNWNSDNPAEYVGKVSMYLGGANIDDAPDAILSKQGKTAALEFFGNTVSSAGDVNGDGNEDLIVGTHPDNNDQLGKVYLFYGPLRSLDADVILTAPGEAAPVVNVWGTYQLQELGDINNDGYGDFCVNGYSEGDGDGKAYIFLGNSDISETDYFTMAGETGQKAGFGTSALALGDITGDGIDDFLIAGPNYGAGAGTWHGKLYLYAGSEDIAVGMKSDIAPVIEKFSLSQNYPNPFNPVTNIQFSISKPGNVTLKIFNNLGQSVTTLVDQNMRAGEHQIKWDGRDSSGNKVSTGIYYYRIKTNSHELTKKMTLLK
jgi:hypothetical protein